MKHLNRSETETALMSDNKDSNTQITKRKGEKRSIVLPKRVDETS